MPSIDIPLAHCADDLIGQFARVTGSSVIAALDGQTLLGERAMLAGSLIPGRISAGGGCRLFETRDGTIALNLSRPSDRDLLPALFGAADLRLDDDADIAACIARTDAASLVSRGRTLGLGLAAEHEPLPAPLQPRFEWVAGVPIAAHRRSSPRVVDLSALWAGPLASHLLWLAGAEVIKVESRTRPDAVRATTDFYALINQGKSSVVVDLANADERRALSRLLASADIVIEASRPRALEQLGIDAAALVSSNPALTWITITAHGVQGDAPQWIGFGDDCAIAGGLSAALRAACGCSGFVGDAIADPLTGLLAALTAWEAWAARRGGRFALAMSHVVAHCLSLETQRDPDGLENRLRAWSSAVGRPFPSVKRRHIGTCAALGEHTRHWLEPVAQC